MKTYSILLLIFLFPFSLTSQSIEDIDTTGWSNDFKNIYENISKLSDGKSNKSQLDSLYGTFIGTAGKASGTKPAYYLRKTFINIYSENNLFKEAKKCIDDLTTHENLYIEDSCDFLTLSAKVHIRNRLLSEGDSLATLAFEICKRNENKEKTVRNLYNLGISKLFGYMYNESIINLEDALNYYNEYNLNERDLLASIYQGLATTYTKSMDLPKAIEYHKMSLSLSQPNTEEHIVALCGIASKLNYLKDNEALVYIKQILNSTIIKRIPRLEKYGLNIASSYFQNTEQNDSLATIYFSKLEILKEQNPHLFEEDEFLKMKGNFYAEIEEFEIAIEALEKCLLLKTDKVENNFDFRKNVLEVLIFSYFGKSGNAIGFDNFKRYKITRDSIRNQIVNQEIIKWEKQYEAERKQLEIEKLEADSELKESQLKASRSLILSIILALVSSLLFTIIFYKRYISEKREKLLAHNVNEDLKDKLAQFEKNPELLLNQEWIIVRSPLLVKKKLKNIVAVIANNKVERNTIKFVIDDNTSPPLPKMTLTELDDNTNWPKKVFMRIHHSTVINLFQIESIDTSKGYVYMKDGHAFSFSKKYQDLLLERFKNMQKVSQLK